MNAEQIQNKVFLLFVSKQPLIDWLPPPLLDNGQYLVGVNVCKNHKLWNLYPGKWYLEPQMPNTIKTKAKVLVFLLELGVLEAEA